MSSLARSLTSLARSSWTSTSTPLLSTLPAWCESYFSGSRGPLMWGAVECAILAEGSRRYLHGYDQSCRPYVVKAHQTKMFVVKRWSRIRESGRSVAHLRAADAVNSDNGRRPRDKVADRLWAPIFYTETSLLPYIIGRLTRHCRRHGPVTPLDGALSKSSIFLFRRISRRRLLQMPPVLAGDSN